MQQTTFENIVEKGEIAYRREFLLLPQWFQLLSIIIILFRVICICLYMYSKSTVVDLLGSQHGRRYLTRLTLTDIVKSVCSSIRWNSFLSLMQADIFLLFGRTNEIIVKQMANQPKPDCPG